MDGLSATATVSGAGAVSLGLADPFLAQLGAPGWEVIGNIGPLGLCVVMVWAGMQKEKLHREEISKLWSESRRTLKVLFQLLLILLEEKGIKPPSLDALSS